MPIKKRFAYLSTMILVTGGSGLVGAHLLWEIIARGQPVRALYRDRKSQQKVKSLFEYKMKTGNSTRYFDKIEWFQADVTDIPTLETAFVGVTQVYHCAALISFDPALLQQMQKINMEGTANMVNLSLKHGVKKFCHISSVAALGKTDNNMPITEENYWTPNNFNSVYSITKFASEAEVWRGTQEGLDAVIVNPAIIIGEGSYSAGSGSFFDYIHNQNSYTVPGSNDFVDVLDVVTIMLKLMESDIKNERFIIAAGHMTFDHLFKRIAHALLVKAPDKQIVKWQAQLAWRMDYILHKVFGKKRTLTKSTVLAAFNNKQYSSSKVKNNFNYHYNPLEKTIDRVAMHYKSQSR